MRSPTGRGFGVCMAMPVFLCNSAGMGFPFAALYRVLYVTQCNICNFSHWVVRTYDGLQAACSARGVGAGSGSGIFMTKLSSAW